MFELPTTVIFIAGAYTQDGMCAPKTVLVFVIDAGLGLHMAVGYTCIGSQWNLLTLAWCNDMRIL